MEDQAVGPWCCSTSVPTSLELGPGFAVVVASDMLFYWRFQHQPDQILPLPPDRPAPFLEATS